MRRLLITLLVVLVLAAVVGGAAHYVLQSDLPRQIAIDQIEQRTGLTAEIDQAQLTWGGQVHVEGVRLTSPMEDEPFFQAERLDVRMRPLLLIALTFNPGLDRVTADGVDLAIRQDIDGQWNVLTAIDRPDREPDRARTFDIPHIELSNARVTVVDAEGRSTRIDQIRMSGEPVGAAALGFELAAEPGIAASGRVNLRGDQRHRVAFELDEVRQIVHDWIAHLDLPSDAVGVQGEWTGRVDDGTVRGRLGIGALDVGPWHGEGALTLRTAADGLRVEIERWQTHHVDYPQLGPLQLTGGVVEFGDERLSARRLQIEAMGNRLRIDGQYAMDDNIADARLRWSGRMPEQMGLDHEGEAELTLAPTTPGRQELVVQLHSLGEVEAGAWEVAGRIFGTGRSVEDMNWQLRLASGQWVDANTGEVLPLGNTGFTFAVDHPKVTLRELSLAGQPIRGEAVGDLIHRDWTASLATEGWEPPVPNLPGPVDLQLVARGTPARADIQTLALRTEGVSVDASGRYMFLAERPLDLDFVAQFEHDVPDAVPDAPLPIGSEIPREPMEPRLAGRVTVDGRMRGSIAPPDLEVEGEAQVDRIVLNRYRMHDVSAPFRASFNGEAARVATTQRFDLLGGRVWLDLRHTFADRASRAAMEVEGLDLTPVAIYGHPDLDLAGAVNASLVLRLSELELNTLHAEGAWDAFDLEVGELARVDYAEGRLSTEQNVVRLDPITLRLDDSVAEGSASYDLLDGRSAHAELTVTDWPHRLDPYFVDARVDGAVSLDLDLVDAAMRGEADVRADVTFRGRELGMVAAAGSLSGQSLAVDRIEADVLDGRITGNATIQFDDLYASRADLNWQGIDLAVAEQWLVYDDELRGRVDGHLRLMPAQLQRAPERLQIELVLEPQEDTGYREVHLGRSVASVFAGPDRVLIQGALLKIGDGNVNIWGQATPREDRWFAHTRVDLENVDVERFNRSFRPEAPPVIGRLGGYVSAFGFADDPGTLAGDGLLRLSQSDLAHTRIIGAVYETLNLRFFETEPAGSGRVRVRVQNGRVRVEEFEFFNRGVNVYGHGTVEDLGLGTDSPIDGMLVGSLRPLRDVNLPFAGDIDRMLQALQTVTGGVRVDGTVRNPRPRQAAVQEVRSTIQRLLGPQQRD